MKLDGNRQRELAAWMWNNGGAQMTAVIALGVVVLAVVVSVQPGSILKDLIAGFGAAGQVFFAGMVWKLSREQFRFTQKVAERQKQIDLLPLRKTALTALKDNHVSLNRYRITRPVIAKTSVIAQDLEPLFSLKANCLIEDYVNAASELFSAIQLQEIASSRSNRGGDTAEIEAHRASSQHVLDAAWTAVASQISKEMKLA